MKQDITPKGMKGLLSRITASDLGYWAIILLFVALTFNDYKLHQRDVVALTAKTRTLDSIQAIDKEFAELQLQFDSIKKSNDSLGVVIKERKLITNKIVNRHAEVRKDISNLNASDSYRLYTANLKRARQLISKVGDPR